MTDAHGRVVKRKIGARKVAWPRTKAKRAKAAKAIVRRLTHNDGGQHDRK